MPQTNISPAGYDAFSSDQHMEALQNRNQQNFLDIMGTNETPEIETEPEQTAENIKAQAKTAMIAAGNFGLQYVLRRSGAISGIDMINTQLQQLESNMMGQWLHKTDRIYKTSGGDWIRWSSHYQQKFSSLGRRGMHYLSLDPQAAAVGSKFGSFVADQISRIPFVGMILGPIARKFLPMGMGAAFVGMEQREADMATIRSIYHYAWSKPFWQWDTQEIQDIIGTHEDTHKGQTTYTGGVQQRNVREEVYKIDEMLIIERDMFRRLEM
jgi:hypothetical protein